MNIFSLDVDLLLNNHEPNWRSYNPVDLEEHGRLGLLYFLLKWSNSGCKFTPVENDILNENQYEINHQLETTQNLNNNHHDTEIPLAEQKQSLAASRTNTNESDFHCFSQQQLSLLTSPNKRVTRAQASLLSPTKDQNKNNDNIKNINYVDNHVATTTSLSSNKPDPIQETVERIISSTLISPTKSVKKVLKYNSDSIQQIHTTSNTITSSTSLSTHNSHDKSEIIETTHDEAKEDDTNISTQISSRITQSNHYDNYNDIVHYFANSNHDNNHMHNNNNYNHNNNDNNENNHEHSNNDNSTSSTNHDDDNKTSTSTMFSYLKPAIPNNPQLVDKERKKKSRSRKLYDNMIQAIESYYTGFTKSQKQHQQTHENNNTNILLLSYGPGTNFHIMPQIW